MKHQGTCRHAWLESQARWRLPDMQSIPVTGYQQSQLHRTGAGVASCGVCIRRNLSDCGCQRVLRFTREDLPIAYALVLAHTAERAARRNRAQRSGPGLFAEIRDSWEPPGHTPRGRSKATGSNPPPAPTNARRPWGPGTAGTTACVHQRDFSQSAAHETPPALPVTQHCRGVDPRRPSPRGPTLRASLSAPWPRHQCPAVYRVSCAMPHQSYDRIRNREMSIVGPSATEHDKMWT